MIKRLTCCNAESPYLSNRAVSCRNARMNRAQCVRPGRADAPGRVPVAGRRPPGAGRVANPDAGGAYRPGVDGGAVAAVLAVQPGQYPPHDPALAPRLHRAVPDPDPAPGPRPAH